MLYLVAVASKQRATHTVRAEAMTGARVHVCAMLARCLSGSNISVCMCHISAFSWKHAEDATVCFDPVSLLVQIEGRFRFRLSKVELSLKKGICPKSSSSHLEVAKCW